MAELSFELVQEICPKITRELFDPMVAEMGGALIVDPRAEAAFLAQWGFESGYFGTLVEAASGRAYEGNKRLGNIQPGDGPRYKGRGPQITGRKNYSLLGEATGIDFVGNPGLLALPENFGRAAVWYWTTPAVWGGHVADEGARTLSELAMQGDFGGITMAINGGETGEDERLELWDKFNAALGVVEVCSP
jgi:putative chitinase